jgi:1-acyl-sn-glycerol-3-phosphate acyltransferase
MNNIEIKVRGLNKIKPGPKVFIANHTSHLDFFTIFYVLGPGFLASSVVKDNIVSNQLTNILPLLIIDRGKKGGNTVDKMRKYVETHESICLFPEGMMTHPDTIIRFRTGAFNVGYPVYPVVLKYTNVVGDMSTPNFILKIASRQHEIIEMHILGPFLPPFDENKIELVRHAMANRGKMVLSRVSNRDIIEK